MIDVAKLAVHEHRPVGTQTVFDSFEGASLFSAEPEPQEITFMIDTKK
jgi:hypothetical protein